MLVTTLEERKIEEEDEQETEAERGMWDRERCGMVMAARDGRLAALCAAIDLHRDSEDAAGEGPGRGGAGSPGPFAPLNSYPGSDNPLPHSRLGLE